MKPYKKTALIIIDLQAGFDDPSLGKRNNLRAEENISKILGLFRQKKLPVFHFQYASINPESLLHPRNPAFKIKLVAKPKKSEPVFSRNAHSIFIGTDLEKILKKSDISSLVFVGLTTDWCISTSVRMGADLGFECFVVADATATFDRKGPIGDDVISYPANIVHELALASLSKEFAEITETDKLIDKLKTVS